MSHTHLIAITKMELCFSVEQIYLAVASVCFLELESRMVLLLVRVCQSEIIVIDGHLIGVCFQLTAGGKLFN